MEQQVAQLIFSKDGKGNRIIQLKDGRIILYYFRNEYEIFIYSEKTFYLLFQIHLEEIIKEYKNQKKDNEHEINYHIKSKNSIKELDNGLILVGRDKYLIELKLNRKSYDYRVIKELKERILDINQLLDKRIIIITTENINIFKRLNEYSYQKI